MDEPRLRRGLLLLTLREQYPLPYSLTALRRALDLHYALCPDEFLADVAYLAGKGFIDRRRKLIRGATREVVHLTPAGVDVVEGSVQDPGVHVEAA